MFKGVNISRRRKATSYAAAATLTVAAALSGTTNAAAQDVKTPPPPEESRGNLAGSVHLDAWAPLERNGLCPADARCLLGGGGGFGAAMMWYFSQAWYARLGYDVIFHGGGSVYELGTMQSLALGIRYHLFSRHRIHPAFGVDVGGLVVGDTFLVDGAGGLIDAGLGAEIELNHRMSAVLYFHARVFATTTFVTRDAASRSRSTEPNVLFGIRASLLIHAQKPLF